MRQLLKLAKFTSFNNLYIQCVCAAKPTLTIIALRLAAWRLGRNFTTNLFAKPIF
jgi:hypothetical protein